MKLYVHARLTRDPVTKQATTVIFKTSPTAYAPVMGYDVYSVYVDSKHDLHAIADQVDLLVGNEVQVAVAAHMLNSETYRRAAA